MPGRALIITGVAMWHTSAVTLAAITILVGWYWLIDSASGALTLAGLNVAGVVLLANGVHERWQAKVKRNVQ